MQGRDLSEWRPESSLARCASTRRGPRAPTILILAALLSGSSAASSQSLPSPTPLIYFRSASFIGAYVPGQIGYRTIVPPLSAGTIDWMQLVPGPKRLYWSESRLEPPSTLVTTYWSARADGADVRPEPDLTSSQIGPSGFWK